MLIAPSRTTPPPRSLPVNPVLPVVSSIPLRRHVTPRRLPGTVFRGGVRGFSDAGNNGQETCSQVYTKETTMKHIKTLSKEAMPAKALTLEDHPSVKDSINAFVADPIGTIQLHLSKPE